MEGTAAQASALFTKIAQVSLECGSVKKDADNPYFSSSYASLNAVKAQLSPHLKKHKLCVFHKSDSQHVMTYIVDTETGEMEMSSLPLPQTLKPQELGSAVTYFRRYNLMMMFDLLAEDDDGNLSTFQGKTPSTTALPQDAKMCEVCGSEMTFKEGTSKTDKPYKAWFCSSGERTHTVFVK